MKKLFLAVAVMLTLIVANVAMAQNPATATTQIQAVKNETLTVATTALPGFVLNAAGTDSTATQDMTITSTWKLTPARNSVTVCAGLTTAGLAGTGANTDAIAAGAVQVSTASTFAAINAAAGCGQTAVTTVSTNSLTTNAAKKSGNKTDTLHVKLTGVDSTIQADTYTGTITVYAYVQ